MPVVKESLTTDDGPNRAQTLSVDPRKVAESDTLREQNDSSPDPTGEDAWPLERAVAQTGNAPGTGNNAAPSHRVGTCYLDPDTGETVMPGDFFGEKELRWRTDENGNRHDSEPVVTAEAEGCAADKLRGVHVAKCPVCLHELENDEGILCDHCGEPTGVGSFAVVNGPGGVFVYHLRCYDEVYWGVDKTLDTLDPTLDTEADNDPSSVPFAVQEFLFESLAEEMVAQLPHLIFTHSERIVEMARDRFRKGYAQHGSTMYSWSPERRLDETLQELADAVVYPTSGPIE